jgi:hypothetical protein
MTKKEVTNMCRKLFLFIIVPLFLAGTAYSQQLLPHSVNPGQWIKSWML